MPDFNLADFRTVEKLDAVPEDLRPLYGEAPDGGFAITEGMTGIFDRVTGLSKALKTAEGVKGNANKEAADARAASKAYTEYMSGLGLDPELGIEALQTFVTELTSKSKDGKQNMVDLESAKKTMAKAHGEEITILTGEIAKRDSAIEKYLINDRARQSLIKNGAEEGVELLLPHVRTQCKVIMEDGEYKTVVLDSEGNTRTDGKGGMMTVDGLVEEMKRTPIYARAFSPEGTKGIGKPAATNLTGMPNLQANESVKPVDRIKKGLDARKAAG